MKNLLSFELVALFFLVLLSCVHTPESQAGTAKPQETATTQTTEPPQVELSETVFDFGIVRVGNDYVHAFKIRNTGTGVLVIRKILPG